MDVRGLSIAEGDILVFCIRLFSELLVGRYKLHAPTHPETLLSKHAAGIFERCAQLLATMPSHRDDTYNNLILPQSELYIQSLGYALAFSCALDAGVPRPLLDLFECYVMKLDLAWFIENAGITDAAFRRREDAAVLAALPHLKEYVDDLDVRRWATAPILTDKSWSEWLGMLPVQKGFEQQDPALYGKNVTSVVPVVPRL